MKNAIVCLTRGYGNTGAYGWLIQRNKAIKEHINKENKYPLLIFHEGNIPEDHQKFIKEHSDGQNLEFIDISATWSGGYEGMCRFQTYDLWNYCAGYDNIMRIDEDCLILECPNDPFDLIVGDNVYLRSVYFAESHSETNATLPQRIMGLTGENPDEFYNNKFVYTNVSVSNVTFWLRPEMNRILKEIAYSEAQRANRWGDLPVLGSLLNIFAKGKVGHIEGLKYKHISHNNIIHSNGVD